MQNFSLNNKIDNLDNNKFITTIKDLENQNNNLNQKLNENLSQLQILKENSIISLENKILINQILNKILNKINNDLDNESNIELLFKLFQYINLNNINNK